MRHIRAIIPLDIGDEALFAGAQMYRGNRAVQRHFRGVVMRKGRAVVTYLDFNRMTTPPSAEAAAEQQKDAHLMARRFDGAPWLRTAG